MMRNRLTIFWQLFVFMLMFISNQTLANNASPISAPNDTLIVATINTRLKTNTCTHPYKISVSSTNGIVTLNGPVHSIIEASQAVQIAASTDGVIDVNTDNLVLQQAPIKPAGDSYITAKVRGLFLREQLIEKKHNVIQIDTRDGTVYLSGRALDQIQANRMISAARSVNGVSKVIAKFTLQQKIITPDKK
jgi:hyperosmotically inducible periplasmic protein